MDIMPLRMDSSSLICSICALAVIILQLVAMECQKLHTVDSPILASKFYQDCVDLFVVKFIQLFVAHY